MEHEKEGKRMRQVLDTKARGIPAVTATRVLVTQPWTTNRTKAAREKRAKANSPIGAALKAADAYMPRAVVTGSAHPARKRRTPSNPVITTTLTYAERIARYGATNGGNADA